MDLTEAAELFLETDRLLKEVTYAHKKAQGKLAELIGDSEAVVGKYLFKVKPRKSTLNVEASNLNSEIERIQAANIDNNSAEIYDLQKQSRVIKTKIYNLVNTAEVEQLNKLKRDSKIELSLNVTSELIKPYD